MTCDLKTLYNQVYSGEKGSHFLKYRDGRVLGAVHELAIDLIADIAPSAQSILDVGCGEADFLGHLGGLTRKVGLDYSAVALDTARKNYPVLELVEGNESWLDGCREEYDIVSSFGTLEHISNYEDVFKRLVSATKPGGTVMVSTPSFLNVRGVVWMTLVKLFDVPMSLSDRHFFTVADFRDLAERVSVKLSLVKSVDHEVAQGDYFSVDMTKRLTNALRDAKMDNSRVDELVGWMQRNMDDFASDELSGAETLYVFTK